MGAKPLIVWFQTVVYISRHWMGHKQLVSGSRHTCMQCLFCRLPERGIRLAKVACCGFAEKQRCAPMQQCTYARNS